MSTPGPNPNQIELDPRLQAALRHAPDHDAAPAPELSAAILRAARNATAGGLPPAPLPRLTRLIAVLDRWWRRPALATGFAGIVLSAVIVLLWSGEEAPPAAPLPQARPVPPAPTEPGTQFRGDMSTGKAGALSSSPDSAQRHKRADAAAETSAAEARTRNAEAANLMRANRSEGDSNRQRAMAQQGEMPPTLSRLANLQGADGAAWRGWRRQTGASAIEPAGPQARAWLALLLQLAAGRWARAQVPASQPQNDPGTAVDTVTVRWLEGDALAAEVVIGADTLVWIEPDGRRWAAPLTPDGARRLRAF